MPPPILSRDIKVPSLTSFSHCKRLAFAESSEKLTANIGQKGWEAQTVTPIPKINCEAVRVTARAAAVQLPQHNTSLLPREAGAPRGEGDANVQDH